MLRLLFYKVACCYLIFTLYSCNKQSQWLDIRDTKSAIVPSSLSDFQAILDNESIMNFDYPSFGLLGTDNFYISDVIIENNLLETERNVYLWKQETWPKGWIISDWDQPYRMIAYCNIVLDGLQKISVTSKNEDEYNQVKGSALFYRAMAFYNLASIFCLPYDASTSSSDLGIPIRLVGDANLKSIRTTVEGTYFQIESDLLTALEILPERSSFLTRPSKISTNAMLAKVYLTMENYNEARLYAERTLAQHNNLVDFNFIDNTIRFPFPTIQGGMVENKEVIFYARSQATGSLLAYSSLANVDPVLYSEYEEADLRRTTFFDQGIEGKNFKGTYSGHQALFSGIATNEIYLIRAECNARLNKTQEGIADLNLLLKNRYKTGSFKFLDTSNPDSLLHIILKERRKELPFTAQIRWEDLRRLNKSSNTSLTVKREVNNIFYSLEPNDPRYVLPIPDYEIELSGIEQNIR